MEKIARRNINNLRYADGTTLMAESEEELKSLLMKVKEESEKVGLKLIFFAAKDGEALYSQQKQGQELTVAQIMNSLLPNSGLNLNKVGKTTRSFRYDLNQIPYDYTLEVRNRYNGLDLIVCLMNYGRRFVTLYRRQGSRPSLWKRNAKKQNGCLGRPYK